MRRRHGTLLLAAMALVVTPARAQELGPVMPSTPDAIEATPSAPPIAVRQEEMEAFLRRAPLRPEDPAPPSTTSREYTADEPPQPVVNQTSQFVFEDQTDRPPVHVKSLAEREAAVEAVRRSVRKAGGR